MLVHESNAYPGMTVKMLAKYASAVMICDEAARKYLPEGCRVVVTGNPLRPAFRHMDEAAKEKARKELGLSLIHILAAGTEVPIGTVVTVEFVYEDNIE